MNTLAQMDLPQASINMKKLKFGLKKFESRLKLFKIIWNFLA